MISQVIRDLINLAGSTASAVGDLIFTTVARWRARFTAVSNLTSELDQKQLSTASLVVFVTLTATVSVLTILTKSDLVTLLIAGKHAVWTGGVADNDGDGLRMLWGVFQAAPNQNYVVVNLARVAFAIVLGQVLHELNDRVARYSNLSAVAGMSGYVLLLLIFFGRTNPIAWVMLSELFVLIYHGLVLVGVLCSSLFSWTIQVVSSN